MTYCIKCKKDTENIDPKIVRTKNNRLVMQSKCSICGIKKSRFIKEQEAKGYTYYLGYTGYTCKYILFRIDFYFDEFY